MSITGSEKVCESLHKFGHSISCSQEKEILTEIAEEISQKKESSTRWTLSRGRTCNSHCMGQLWRIGGFSHGTPRGYTRHYGPCLPKQKKTTDDAPPPFELASVSTDGPTFKKRRQNYTGKGKDLIVPYMKIPKAKQFSFNSYQAITPTSCQTAKSLNNLWLFVCSMLPAHLCGEDGTQWPWLSPSQSKG